MADLTKADLSNMLEFLDEIEALIDADEEAIFPIQVIELHAVCKQLVTEKLSEDSNNSRFTRPSGIR